MESLAQAISNYLFSEKEGRAFAVLDGASIPGLLENLYHYQPEHVCLYRGELEPDMAEVAPYLVALEPNTQFTGWVLEQGWGKHWGVFVISPADLRALRQHFRTFLIVHNSGGQPLYFRYYDPRVLRVYLPTCNVQELATVFGPVVSYLVEDADPNTLLCFRTVSGALRQEKIPLALGSVKPVGVR